jgi:hypothetical protein
MMSAQSPFATSDRPFQIFVWLAVLGAAACLILLAIRSYFAISFTEPMQVHTTGDEFSQFYAVWRQIQGLPVYTDRFSPPYYYAIYNWLFYYSYGFVTGIVLDLFSLKDAWVPTVARFISLAGMVVGIFACYVSYLRACGSQTGRYKALSLAFAIFILAGPLVGYWNITVRSDLWARTLEIVGIALFIIYYPKDRWMAILWMILFGYLAWAFKQGSVFSVGAVGLFLLARRDWAPLFVFSSILALAWGLTIYFGEPQYVYNFLLKDFPIIFSYDRMVRNLVNFSVKSGPVLFYLAALVFVIFSTRERLKLFWQNDNFVLGCGGIFCATVIAVPGSAQLGGAENYFFSLSFFLGLMVCASLPILAKLGEAVWTRTLAAGNIGWATLLVAIGLVLSGSTGVINVRNQHTNYMAGKRCIDSLPRPLYVNNPYLSLPWMAPNTEPYVVSYNYLDDRNAGQAFKFGGIGGLISTGHFKVLAIQRGGKIPPKKIDGGHLKNYTLVHKKISAQNPCGKFFIFNRI